jgi:hypothetical protein
MTTYVHCVPTLMPTPMRSVATQTSCVKCPVAEENPGLPKS